MIYSEWRVRLSNGAVCVCGEKMCSEVCGVCSEVGYSSCLIDPSFASQSHGYVSQL